MQMKSNTKKILVVVIIFVIFVAAGIIVSRFIDTGSSKAQLVVGAVGGGKENFLADADVNRILEEKYNIKVDNQAWSNGKMITDPLTYTKNNKQINYDFAFFSDERFYEYYKQPATGDESARLPILDSGITLSTPVVFYSWKDVADALTKDGIVKEENGVSYITDMPRLLEYIETGKQWSEVGLGNIYGAINIASTDPVTSSPGATYYGLLASVMNNGPVNNQSIDGVLPKLQSFYKYSGFLNNTPSDLFDLYLRMGMGAYPIVVDYEKSMLDFAINNPTGFDQVKDKIVILYSQPTIWNSHCIVSFSEGGNTFMKAMSDPEIQKIAWEKYGFRTGVIGGNYDVDVMPVSGVPKEITSVVPGLKKEVYDKMIDALKAS